MITCGMNVKKARVKKRMLMNTYHRRGTLIRMCHKNSEKNCLVTVMGKKTVLKVFRCYLVAIENKTKKFCTVFLNQN